METSDLVRDYQPLELEAENCGPAVSFNGNFLKKLAQAARKMEPDKEYTLQRNRKAAKR